MVRSATLTAARHRARWCTATLCIGLVGCELGSTTIPRAEAVLVVHSVLIASTRTTYVLVEQSLTGSMAVVDSGVYDPSNPIVSGNGVPVKGAIVTLTDQNGDVTRGVELVQNGAGVYVITLGGGRIRSGWRYALAVSAQGKTVTGTTLVPGSTPPVNVTRVPFNRDHDTVNLAISDVALARAYWVRIDAPIVPFSLFTLDRTIAIAGDTRNVFTTDLIHVFYPGFIQTMTVAAVDSNVYDYYRSGNDPFSGRGLINHLSGGLGVFGSIGIVDQRQLDVTQDSVSDPIEGRYTLRRGMPIVANSGASEMTLFLEARGNNSPDRVTGRYLNGPVFDRTRGAVFGTRTGDSVTLQLLVAQSTTNVNYIFTGIAKGDSLIGDFHNSLGPAMYVKAGK